MMRGRTGILRSAAALSAVLCLVVAGCGRAHHRPTVAAASAPMATASPSSSEPSTKVILGAYLDLHGMNRSQALALREQQFGRSLRMIHLYLKWTDPLMDEVNSVPAGALPLLSWGGPRIYSTITNGSQDALIKRQAKAVASYGKPVYLDWSWEMNGTWFDWSGVNNPDRTAGFIKAWRHLHDVFIASGARNVIWVWNPNYYSVPAEDWNAPDQYYPGDEYVDWVAVDGYSYGRLLPEDLFGKIYNTYSARKPIMIAETGVSDRGGRTKADWILALESWIDAKPRLGALVWFDTDTYKGSNWRIDTDPSAVAAYRALANDPHFGG